LPIRPVRWQQGTTCDLLSRRNTIPARGKNRMQRREFMAIAGGAVAWPFAVRAQPSSLPTIGFLSARSPEDSQHVLQAFYRGLKEEGGYADGESVRIEYRWARGNYALLPALAA